MTDFKARSLHNFWGPSLTDFVTLNKFAQLTWLGTLIVLAWKSFGLNYSTKEIRKTKTESDNWNSYLLFFFCLTRLLEGSGDTFDIKAQWPIRRLPLWLQRRPCLLRVGLYEVQDGRQHWLHPLDGVSNYVCTIVCSKEMRILWGQCRY